MLAIDFDEDFIDVEGVAIATVTTFQAAGINGSKFDAPQADRFSGDSYASFSQEIFDIPMTEIETVVEPDGITDDIGRESVPFIRVHGPILPK